MTKNISLKILSVDDVYSSYIIEASVETEGIQATCSSVFTLFSLNDSLDKFESWRNSLRQCFRTRRGSRGKAIAYADPSSEVDSYQQCEKSKNERKATAYASSSEVESYQQCEKSKNELFESFNQLLEHNPLKSWLQDTLDMTVEPIRVIIQTDSLKIATLPWEQWSFWDSYYDKKDLVIALNFLDRSNSKISSSFTQKPLNENAFPKTKILVLLGEESHGESEINLEVDKQEFQKFEDDLEKLDDRANVYIHVCQPNRTELERILQDTWHIIYYGGHSRTLKSEKDGILYLQDQTQVKISELERLFRKIIGRGELRLLVANACQGLGTAFQLVPLGLPNAIVMRESIPDDFAHDFLRYLLESFIIGLPVASAIQHCRPHLREAYDLRYQLPGASLLPALCITSESINAIDTPVIPLDGLHPICKEMRALANLAKARLTLEDAKNVLSALQVQEYYANLLNHKNKITYEKARTEVNFEQLSCSQPQILGKRIWQIDFQANVQGQSLIFGQGYVNVKTGDSELLLDIRPWSWTGVPVSIAGEEVKQLCLAPEAEAEMYNKVQKLSFTKFALFNLEQEYRKYASLQFDFNGVSEVRSFGGWLKDTNKKKFLKQLVILQNQGLTYDDAKNRAYLETPFGKARDELGITDVQITPFAGTFAPLKQVMSKDEWTEKDYKDLREGGVSDDLWMTFDVPQHIIVSLAKRPRQRT